MAVQQAFRNAIFTPAFILNGDFILLQHTGVLYLYMYIDYFYCCNAPDSDVMLQRTQDRYRDSERMRGNHSRTSALERVKKQ